jgi:hypothetical protein
MKTPTKKSSVKKSKSKKKSPLLKYQTAGFGGSDSYSGFDKGLDYQGFYADFTPTSRQVHFQVLKDMKELQ